MNMIEADFAEEQNRIKAQLKDKAEHAKNTERDKDPRFKPLIMYPST